MGLWECPPTLSTTFRSRQAEPRVAVKSALIEAVERRRNDPEFKKTLKRIIEQDRELLERLAK